MQSKLLKKCKLYNEVADRIHSIINNCSVYNVGQLQETTH